MISNICCLDSCNRIFKKHNKLVKDKSAISWCFLGLFFQLKQNVNNNIIKVLCEGSY